MVTLQEANEMIRRYPFHPRFSIYLPRGHQTAEQPPKERVAVYVDQLEARLRMPTTRFFRDSLRYWGVRVTQLTPNAVRILIGFELLCRDQGIAPTVTLFRRCYTIKNSDKKGWFYFGNRNKHVPKLIVDTPSSIKEWKHNFIFVPADDFLRGF